LIALTLAPQPAQDTVLATQIAPHSISALAMGNVTPSARIGLATRSAALMTHVILIAIQIMTLLLVAKVAIVAGVA